MKVPLSALAVFVGFLATAVPTPAQDPSARPDGKKPSESPDVKIRETKAVRDKDGFLVHEVESPYQKGKTQVFVLTPDKMEEGKKYPVVYVLPVEPGSGTRWGNGLLEIKKLDLHNKFGIIFVMPTFSDWPWYCDHPTDPQIRQETYLLEVVIPLIERSYPVLPGSAGRLLVGFSKSGWGAFSLLLRHPDVFGRAAAWDAPLNMAAPNQFGMGPIFGTQENFEKYRISSLLTKNADTLKSGSRLAMIGYDNFRPHHQAIHEQMNRFGIAHEYADVRQGKHDWRSGWLEAAVRFLAAR
jgi:enterochelin esterase-like enzyme